MVTIARPQRLTLPTRLPPPPVLAAGAGGLVALVFLLLPGALLERIVTSSGIAAVVAAAEPPLGLTARVALALLVGGGVAAFAWIALSTVADAKLAEARPGGLFGRGDSHPDAPPRPPLFATRDLGTPFLDVKAPAEPAPRRDAEVERDLPVDLDQPMAAFDPAALLDVPLASPEPVSPLARPALIDPGDRFETFELTPVARARPLSLRVPPAAAAPEVEPLNDEPRDRIPAAPPPMIGPEVAATVHDLLARLERGLVRPPAPAPVPAAPLMPAPAARHTLQDTLGDLRRMATEAR